MVIDPLTAFLGRDASAAGDQTVRRALMPLVGIAAETGCTILVVRHLRKQGGRALYRGLGSIGIIGAARVGWLLGEHPRGEGLRVLTVTKSNLVGPAGPAGVPGRRRGGGVARRGGVADAGRGDGDDAGVGGGALAGPGVAAGPEGGRGREGGGGRGRADGADVVAGQAVAGGGGERYYGQWYRCLPGDDPVVRFAGLAPLTDPKCHSEVEAGPAVEPRDPHATPAELKRWARRVLARKTVDRRAPRWDK